MGKWKRLDLSSNFTHPPINEWTALRLVPKSGLHTDIRHDIGYFQPDPHTGRKLWWYGSRGCENPIKMKKDYDIWWCLVPPFDAA